MLKVLNSNSSVNPKTPVLAYRSEGWIGGVWGHVDKGCPVDISPYYSTAIQLLVILGWIGGV